MQILAAIALATVLLIAFVAVVCIAIGHGNFVDLNALDGDS